MNYSINRARTVAYPYGKKLKFNPYLYKINSRRTKDLNVQGKTFRKKYRRLSG